MLEILSLKLWVSTLPQALLTLARYKPESAAATLASERVALVWPLTGWVVSALYH